MTTPFPIAALISGAGSTLENIFQQIESGRLDAEVRCVVTSRAKAKGLAFAQKRGVATAVVTPKAFDTVEAFSEAVFEKLAGCELVALAGFMSLLAIPEPWVGRVINVHPALIPAFCGRGMYGRHVHEAVIDYGVKVTGCTVHFVDNEYDHGPVIAQRAVAVENDDTPETLAARVQAVERELYPQVIQAVADGRVHLDGRKVRIEGGL